MNKENKKEAQQDPVQQINLDEYAGDRDDNRIATEQANRYMEDIERAKEKGTLRPDDQQPE